LTPPPYDRKRVVIDSPRHRSTDRAAHAAANTVRSSALNVATEYTTALIGMEQTQSLAHSALPHAPVRPDERPGTIASLVRRSTTLARRFVAPLARPTATDAASAQG
jgi:hypothetical protein